MNAPILLFPAAICALSLVSCLMGITRDARDGDVIGVWVFVVASSASGWATAIALVAAIWGLPS